MVGVTGFEPAASSSRTTRATKLRHTPCDAGVSLSGDFFRGALQTQRVERFHEVGLATAALGHLCIGVAVEQHENRNVRQATTRFVETKVHRDGHAPHGSDLRVEDSKVGCARTDRVGDVTAVRADGEGGFGRTEGRDHFVENPLGVGGNQNVHDATLVRGPQNRPKPANRGKRVVPLVEQLGDQLDRYPRSLRQTGAQRQQDRFLGVTFGSQFTEVFT